MEQKSSSIKTVCFVAGKSGGHLIPALTRAQLFLEEKKADKAILFSTNTALDHEIVKKHASAIEHIALPLHALPKQLWKYPLFFLQLLYSFIQSVLTLHRLKPKRIISMGGLISIPVCLAGKLLRIPIELHELNVVPGKAISFLARFATTISICFEETKQYLPPKCQLIAYPVRFTLAPLLPTQTRFHPISQRKTVFVMGGSQGSRFLNELIRNWITHCTEYYPQIRIIHQTGNDPFNWSAFYTSRHIPHEVFDYYPRLEECYTIADLIISRAGAGALFEIAFFKKQCMVIPLETATNTHQKNNAYAMARRYPESFTVLTQAEINNNADRFGATIKQLLFRAK